MTKPSFTFSSKHLAQIRHALPPKCSAHRLELLPTILAEWALVDLVDHSCRETAAEMRAKHLRSSEIIKLAKELSQALDGLSNAEQHELALKTIGWPEKRIFFELGNSEIAAAEIELTTLRECLARLKNCALDKSAPRGRSPNLTAFLILLDIQVIFEYLTKTRATRRIHNKDHPDTGQPYGPFWDFSSAVWRSIYGSDEQLAAAMKNWAAYKLKHKDRSPLIDNIHMQHPEWRIFDG